MRPLRWRRAAPPAVLVACGLCLWPALAGGLPPGGVAEQPGTPPGSVRVTAPSVTPEGEVGFCVEGFRVDTVGGRVAQPFMVKFDDHGSYGIGPFTPDANGTLCAAVSTAASAHAGARGGAADKIPADLCDPSKEHWLRFLSGPWAANTTPAPSMRSLAATFTVGPGCGNGPAGAGGGGGGGGDAGGGDSGGGPGGGSGDAAASVPPRLGSTRLRAGRRRVVVPLRTSAAVKGRLILKSAGKLRVGGDRGRVLVLARGRYAFPRAGRATTRVELTRAGRRALAEHAFLKGRLTLDARPFGGAGRASTRTVSVDVRSTVATPRALRNR